MSESEALAKTFTGDYKTVSIASGWPECEVFTPSANTVLHCRPSPLLGGKVEKNSFNAPELYSAAVSLSISNIMHYLAQERGIKIPHDLKVQVMVEKKSDEVGVRMEISVSVLAIAPGMDDVKLANLLEAASQFSSAVNMFHGYYGQIDLRISTAKDADLSRRLAKAEENVQTLGRGAE